MTSTTNRLLMIDDEPAICEFVGTVAEGLGFEVQATGDADKFRVLVRDFEPTALILDLNMPGADGIELLRFLAEEQCQAHILVISGEDSRVLAAAQRLGTTQGLQMSGTLQKPVLLPVLRGALEKVMQQTITASDLRSAIEMGDLLAYYQPIITRREEGAWLIEEAEALVRWRHSKLGMVMPNDFIPLAEESDLIGPLTDFMLRETLEQLGVWHNHGIVVNVAVNIAPELLTDVEFPDRLSSFLQQYGIEGSSLTLEITETAAMQNVDATMDVLTRLRLKGIQLAIDDFGTGYSSLKQLFYLPFSELKIDRSFVMEVVESGEARTMVSAMIQLGHNLNMSVCAEGVETREALDFLEAEGCDKVQGYFISRPISAANFEKFIHAWPSGGGKELLQ